MLVALAWVTFAFAARVLAGRRDRIASIWFIFGAILGPVALLLLWVAPPGRCRSCGTRTRGWLETCASCGENVAATSTTALRILARREAARTNASPASRPADTSRANAPDTDPPASRPFVPFTLKPANEPPTSSVAAAPSSSSSEPKQSTRVASGKARRSPPSDVSRDTAESTEVLATAIYVTGTARLEPGRRYNIALRGARLLILGPIDLDSATVALESPASGIEVRAIEGRLILSQPRNRAGFVVAFMSVAGAGPEGLADAIGAAAQGSKA
jgi:hypothetical protein